MKPDDFLVQAWKQQLDAGLRAAEAILEGATRMHEAQLEAAAEAHAAVVATRRAIAGATDAQDLMRMQAQWAGANMEKCTAYWRTMQETAMETHAELLKCLPVQAATALPDALKGADLESSKQALLGMIDSACKQWLDATQQFYRLPEGPGTVQGGRPAR
jgi:phasin family protein